MFTSVFIGMQPGRGGESAQAPHGQIDALTMQQWKERHKRALEAEAETHGTA
jgi:hypothetical protein